MSLTDYVIMPAADYLDACNATREKTGGTEPIKSGEMGGLIRGISGGGASGGGLDIASAIVDGSITEYTDDKVTTISACAFYNKTLLQNVSCPAAQTIWRSAFEGCDELISANFPEVTTMWERAFRNCDRLTSVNFPKLTRCYADIFYGAARLTNVSFPMLENVSGTAFKQCVRLVTVDLPACKRIASGAFATCYALEAIILRNTETVVEIDLTAFDGSGLMFGTGFIYVPESMYEAYRTAYSDALETAFGVPGIFDGLFRKIEDYPEICG